MRHRSWRRWGSISTVAAASQARLGWAATAGNMPLQQFFSQLYTAGTGTYLPMLALLILITSVMNWHYGWVDIGTGLGKLILSIAILAGGVGLVVGWVGGGTIGTALVM